MSTLGSNFARVTGYIRNLRGGTQPILAQASDGLLYVVKFTKNLQGSNLPFNESIGTEIYRACGLAVPSWKPLLVTNAFIDQNPDCWMQTPEGKLQPESGLCFGSRFLGGDGIRLLEILPGTSIKRIRNLEGFWLAWLIDICAHHADTRQAIFQEDANGGLNAFFVDHGHLFGGPKGDQHPHFLASRYLDPRIYQSVSSRCLLNFQRILGSSDVDQLWQTVHELPQDWRTESALKGFGEFLGRLSNSALVRNVLDTMVDSHQRTSNFERYGQRDERHHQVLRLGVQAAEVVQQLIASSFHRRASA